MNRFKMLFRLSIFILIVVSVLIYQQYLRREFTTYLEAINECFKDVESLQHLSIEANKAGMSGNHEKEAEINATLLRRSEQFVGAFDQVTPPNRAILKMHTMLQQLNTSTHELLSYRIKVLNQVKDGSLSNAEKQAKLDEFWKMQDTNQLLYRQLSAELHKYAERRGVQIPDYLSNFEI